MIGIEGQRPHGGHGAVEPQDPQFCIARRPVGHALVHRGPNRARGKGGNHGQAGRSRGRFEPHGRCHVVADDGLHAARRRKGHDGTLAAHWLIGSQQDFTCVRPYDLVCERQRQAQAGHGHGTSQSAIEVEDREPIARRVERIDVRVGKCHAADGSEFARSVARRTPGSNELAVCEIEQVKKRLGPRRNNQQRVPGSRVAHAGPPRSKAPKCVVRIQADPGDAVSFAVGVRVAGVTNPAATDYASVVPRPAGSDVSMFAYRLLLRRRTRHRRGLPVSVLWSGPARPASPARRQDFAIGPEHATEILCADQGGLGLDRRCPAKADGEQRTHADAGPDQYMAPSGGCRPSRPGAKPHHGQRPSVPVKPACSRWT